MAGLSKVILIGNLGRDPETRYTPNGTMNVQFSMAVTRRRNDQSGQPQETTTWFRVTAWGKLAEIMDGLTQRGALVKGKQVYVEGRLESREYQDQAGQTRTSLDVNANEFQLLGSRADSEMASGSFGGGRGSGGQRSETELGRGDQGADFDDVPF
ncbi:MAG: single-stranded DNA-binding protein [Chloroflexota bacterium]|nr:single-stranded DNA-binding protein [Chloroflexota bacterium]